MEAYFYRFVVCVVFAGIFAAGIAFDNYKEGQCENGGKGEWHWATQICEPK